MATPRQGPPSYREAQLAARAAAGRFSREQAERMRALVDGYADDVARMALASGSPQAITSARAARVAAQRLADDVELAIAEGRQVTFEHVQAAWMEATEVAAASLGVPDALLGAVRVPSLTMLGAYARLGGAATTWRTLVRERVGQASREADMIVQQALIAGMRPDELAKRLRPYLQGAEPFTAAFGGTAIADKVLRDPRFKHSAGKLLFNVDRVAFSEVHNARAEAEVQHFAADPMVWAVAWRLSPNRGHLAGPDACDALASSDFYGLGAGVYPVDAVPGPPHPFDRCERVPVVKYSKTFKPVKKPLGLRPDAGALRLPKTAARLTAAARRRVDEVALSLVERRLPADAIARSRALETVAAVPEPPTLAQLGVDVTGLPEDLLAKLDSPEYRQARAVAYGARQTLLDQSKARQALRREWLETAKEFSGFRSREEMVAQVGEAMLGAVRPDGQPKTITFIMGPPGSYKSTVASPLMKRRPWAKLVDSDEFKAMTPEFNGGIGANAVHAESGVLADQWMLEAMEEGSDIVHPVVGRTWESMEGKIREAYELGYRVEVYYNDMTAARSAASVYKRWEINGRFIDAAYVLRDVRDLPGVTFDLIKRDPRVALAKKFDANVDFKPGLQLENTERYTHGVATETLEEGGEAVARSLADGAGDGGEDWLGRGADGGVPVRAGGADAGGAAAEEGVTLFSEAAPTELDYALHQALPKLTRKESEELYWYTQQGYGNINTYLRGKNLPDWMLEPASVKRYDEQVALLDKAIARAKPIGVRGTLYRGAGYGDPFAELTEAQAKKMVGKVITEKAYLSASTDKKVGQAFAKKSGATHSVVYEISVPGEARALYVTGGESEALLPRGSRLRVTDVKLKGSRYHVKVELEGDEIASIPAPAGVLKAVYKTYGEMIDDMLVQGYDTGTIVAKTTERFGAQPAINAKNVASRKAILKKKGLLGKVPTPTPAPVVPEPPVPGGVKAYKTYGEMIDDYLVQGRAVDNILADAKAAFGDLPAINAKNVASRKAILKKKGLLGDGTAKPTTPAKKEPDWHKPFTTPIEKVTDNGFTTPAEYVKYLADKYPDDEAAQLLKVRLGYSPAKARELLDWEARRRIKLEFGEEAAQAFERWVPTKGGAWKERKARTVAGQVKRDTFLDGTALPERFVAHATMDDARVYLNKLGVKLDMNLTFKGAKKVKEAQALEAANQAASALTELRRMGYQLPKQIRIVKMNGAGQYMEWQQSLSINPVSAVNHAQRSYSFKTGWWASDDPRQIVFHEAAHFLHQQGSTAKYKLYQATYKKSGNWNSFTQAERLAAKRVSTYASSDPLEVVAEVFTGWVTEAKRFDDEVMALYDKLGGPPLPGRKKVPLTHNAGLGSPVKGNF